jgi:hypothetical protein
MRVAVIGSRSFNDYELLKNVLSEIKVDILISGGAKGADTLAEKYALKNNIKTEIFYPEWSKYGKKAGFLRNTKIIENADLIVAFWDGTSKGTLDSIEKSKKNNKKIIIINF